MAVFTVFFENMERNFFSRLRRGRGYFYILFYTVHRCERVDTTCNKSIHGRAAGAKKFFTLFFQKNMGTTSMPCEQVDTTEKYPQSRRRREIFFIPIADGADDSSEIIDDPDNRLHNRTFPGGASENR